MTAFRNSAAHARLVAGFATLLLTGAANAQKQAETSPLLVPIEKTHCLVMYDQVELRLKGRGDETASTTTRNGLKDFFVTRPGVVDCSGQRDIPWRDDKDRDFILSVLQVRNDGSKLDMGKDYGIAPAAKPVTPIPGR